MPESLELLEVQLVCTHVFAALDTLEFLCRSGRVNGSVGGIVTLLQIKQLLKIYDREPSSERVRITNGVNRRLLELLEEKKLFERIALVHANTDEKARALLEQVQAELPEREITSVDITPVIGAHIGPGAIGFTVISAKPDGSLIFSFDSWFRIIIKKNPGRNLPGFLSSVWGI